MKKVLIAVLLQAFVAVSYSQNVGIGETSPVAARLQVKAADSSVLIVENATSTGTEVRTGLFFKTGLSYSGSISSVGGSYTHRLGFFTYGGLAPSSLQERLSILDAGNVGIGTTTPGARLEVNGQLKITGGNPGAGRILESDATGLASWVDKPSGGGMPTGAAGNTLRHNGTSFIATSNLYNDGARVGIGTTAPTSMLEIKAGAAQTADLELNASAGDNAVLRLNRSGLSGGSIIRFKTANALKWDLGTLLNEDFKLTYVPTNTAVLTIDDATRNVGIGTTDFTEALNVNGNIGSFGAIISKQTSSNGFLFQDRSANAYGGWVWYADAGKANLFRYGGLGNAITIDATGKMGLGIAAPTAPLSFPNSLGKKISLYPGTTGDAGMSVFGNEFRIHSDYNAADITFGYDNFTNGFTERVRMKANGNVGIGVNPTEKLEVRTSSGEVGWKHSYSATESIYSQGASIFSPAMIRTSGDGLGLMVGNTYGLVVTTAGNVSVGSTSATVKLDVNGRLRLRKEGAFGSGLWIDGPTELQQSFIGMEDDDNIGFYSNTAGWIHHFNAKSGVVRLGTGQAAAGYMLNVGGKIIAEEIRVQLKTAWPDYVFADNYLLKPLSEVEQFIKINKHLPNVPSAAVVSQDGQMLGEMQSRLLEKIEELTLYVIDLNKKLEQQEKLIQELKSKQ